MREIAIGTPVSDLNARTGRVLACQEAIGGGYRYQIEWENGKVGWYSAWITDMLAKNVNGD